MSTQNTGTMEVSSSITSAYDSFTYVDPTNQHNPNTGQGAQRELQVRGGWPKREARADELRIKLRQRILESKNYRKPLNILLVGVAGVGKSSFINSVIRAIIKKYGQWVMAGSSVGAGRANITALLHWINILNPDSNDPELLTPEEMPADSDSEDVDEADEKTLKKQKKLKKEQATLLRMAPRIIDVCGLANENNPTTREVLRLLMYGHIPASDNVLGAYALGAKEGVAALRAKYPRGIPDLAVHRVVVVHAAGDKDFPAELVKAVMATARPLTSTDDGLVCKRTVPVFGLITMNDLIEKMGDAGVEKYESMRSKFIEGLDLGGSTSRFSECQNYHSELGEALEDRVNNPTIDEKLLRFMYELCDRTIKCDNPSFQLEFIPTPQSTAQPIIQPTSQPTPRPTILPTLQPTSDPTQQSAPNLADPQKTPTCSTGPSHTPPHSPPHVNGQYTVALIILALSVYIGVLLHYGVFSSMIEVMGAAGVIPSTALILTPLLFLAYVYHNVPR